VHAFSELDHDGRGFIYKEELGKRLEEQGVGKVTKEELELFMEKFDVDRDGRLQFSDFCLAMTPLNSEYAQLLQSRGTYRAQMTQESHVDYLTLWRKLLMVEQGCECVRQRLQKRPNFSLSEAFSYVDKTGLRALAPIDLKFTLADHGFYATDRELAALMDRFDRDRDGRISFHEFAHELLPRRN